MDSEFRKKPLKVKPIIAVDISATDSGKYRYIYVYNIDCDVHKMAFFGAGNRIEEFFAGLGMLRNPHYNLADFIR
jgi:hypothetical protein